eukprot:TRINITY_DN1628_c0_g2_i1.p1 TRINITY_DN1628_c0_g2~~TRINITY_DN1628_c0_g2_i1.p1  ORF type:complete len:316 (+),score=79.85 TRINITY_DN1628_c0_g2_i1:25-948(+)
MAFLPVHIILFSAEFSLSHPLNGVEIQVPNDWSIFQQKATRVLHSPHKHLRQKPLLYFVTAQGAQIFDLKEIVHKDILFAASNLENLLVDDRFIEYERQSRNRLDERYEQLQQISENIILTSQCAFEVSSQRTDSGVLIDLSGSGVSAQDLHIQQRFDFLKTMFPLLPESAILEACHMKEDLSIQFLIDKGLAPFDLPLQVALMESCKEQATTQEEVLNNFSPDGEDEDEVEDEEEEEEIGKGPTNRRLSDQSDSDFDEDGESEEEMEGKIQQIWDCLPDLDRETILQVLTRSKGDTDLALERLMEM